MRPSAAARLRQPQGGRAWGTRTWAHWRGSGNLALILNDQEGKDKATLLVDSKGEGYLRVKDAGGTLKK